MVLTNESRLVFGDNMLIFSMLRQSGVDAASASVIGLARVVVGVHFSVLDSQFAKAGEVATDGSVRVVRHDDRDLKVKGYG